MTALNVKWIRSGDPARPDAGVDPSDAPFADNDAEEITARTMRNFAYEVDTVLDAWPPGPAGATGPAGPSGPPGPSGASGPTGPQGIQGNDGSGVVIQGTLTGVAEPLPLAPEPGDMWLLGSPVPTAAPNPPGGTKAPGDGIVWSGTDWSNVGPIKGPAGDPGATGPAGSAGPTGATGSQGIQGPQGSQGVQGIQGVQGVAGVAGPIGATGPLGPAGETGLTGSTGPSGASGGSYAFVQLTPATTWTIDHSLPFRPNITVVDSAGTQVEGDVKYATPGQIVLTFTAGFSGSAYLS